MGLSIGEWAMARGIWSEVEGGYANPLRRRVTLHFDGHRCTEFLYVKITARITTGIALALLRQPLFRYSPGQDFESWRVKNECIWQSGFGWQELTPEEAYALVSERYKKMHKLLGNNLFHEMMQI